MNYFERFTQMQQEAEKHLDQSQRDLLEDFIVQRFVDESVAVGSLNDEWHLDEAAELAIQMAAQANAAAAEHGERSEQMDRIVDRLAHTLRDVFEDRAFWKTWKEPVP